MARRDRGDEETVSIGEENKEDDNHLNTHPHTNFALKYPTPPTFRADDATWNKSLKSPSVTQGPTEALNNQRCGLHGVLNSAQLGF